MVLPEIEMSVCGKAPSTEMLSKLRAVVLPRMTAFRRAPFSEAIPARGNAVPLPRTQLFSTTVRRWPPLCSSIPKSWLPSMTFRRIWYPEACLLVVIPVGAPVTTKPSIFTPVPVREMAPVTTAARHWPRRRPRTRPRVPPGFGRPGSPLC